jgi:hypothetical protein
MFNFAHKASLLYQITVVTNKYWNIGGPVEFVITKFECILSQIGLLVPGYKEPRL